MDPIVIFFIVFFIFNMIVTVASIGKPREPITNGVAVFVILVYLILIYLLTRIG